ncbi:MAG: hypothetical protein V9E83_13300 [Baekduia sp.]
MLVAVTDHAAERYRQRIGGTLDPKLEIARRVGEAVQAGRTSETAPPGASGTRGSLYVSDRTDRGLVYVCRQAGSELVVITLWERTGGPAEPRVPRRFTDALRD